MLYSGCKNMKNKKYRPGSLIVLFVLMATVAGGWYLFVRAHTSPLPKQISSQLKFIPFVTQKTAQVSLPEAVTYNSSAQVLTYQTYFSGTHLVTSEQPTPESFSDVPQAYNALINKMRGKDNFDSVNGTVNITYPVELNGTQTAVMNSKGVLIFVKPDKNLSTNDWKQFFNNLQISQ